MSISRFFALHVACMEQMQHAKETHDVQSVDIISLCSWLKASHSEKWSKMMPTTTMMMMTTTTLMTTVAMGMQTTMLKWIECEQIPFVRDMMKSSENTAQFCALYLPRWNVMCVCGGAEWGFSIDGVIILPSIKLDSLRCVATLNPLCIS